MVLRRLHDGMMLLLCVPILWLSGSEPVQANGIRSSAKRIRSVHDLGYGDSNVLLSGINHHPSDVLDYLENEQKEIDSLVEQEDAFLELIETLADANLLSMGTFSPAPSAAPSKSSSPSSEPSISASPSISPMPTVSTSPSTTPTESSQPSQGPSTSVSPSVGPSAGSSSMPSSAPSDSLKPSIRSMPSISAAPSPVANSEPLLTPPPSIQESVSPSAGPTASLPLKTNLPSASPSSQPSPRPTNSPTAAPTQEPTIAPTFRPTQMPSKVPTSFPSVGPSVIPSDFPSASTPPSVTPSSGPTSLPTKVASDTPSTSPTLSSCGVTPEERSNLIYLVLNTVTDPASLRDETTSQGKAASWLIGQDELVLCPDNPKLVQRFVLATTYFATQGDGWFQCSANPTAIDDCGNVEPFVGKERFLSSVNECQWAGITCDARRCVTEIEFELNNLVGTIPTEVALLSDLQVWGMERGGLFGTIPTEIALLQNLIFLDLDFNQLTGSLSSELLSLTSLTQLDLNDNLFTGSIEGIGVFPQMEFLQIHDNFFTGTVPEAIGTYTNMAAFTLHETGVTGTMPESVCNLLVSEGNGGMLESLIADCLEPNPNIICSCCTDCRAE